MIFRNPHDALISGLHTEYVWYNYTIKELIDTYNLLETDTQRENLFSEVKIQGKNRKIGKALSKKIYEYFCK
mgnify:CR=1 FL=1